MTEHELTQEEREIYGWQLDVPGFDEQTQKKLKSSSVLISRVGGVGGIVAMQLALAGVGKLVLAHGGRLKPSDLNRQALQNYSHIGKPRIAAIVRRLQEINPRLEITAFGENVTDDNAQSLVAQADVVVDAAPLFEERFALNRAAVAARKPMVECAMYAMEAHLCCILPGETPCLECFVCERPESWTRRFPVLGAVSSTVGSMAAIETIKLLTGFAKPLAGTLLVMDLCVMEFRKLRIARRKNCGVCSALWPPQTYGAS